MILQIEVKYAGLRMQDMLNVGLNAFGAQLLAESYGDDPEKFGGNGIVVIAPTHKNGDVFITISRTKPTVIDAPIPAAG